MPRRFLAPRWLAFHLLTLVLVVVFCRLGWWQVRRAGQGNPLSYGYALEWPVFAVFTLFVWYRTVRDTVRPPVTAPTRPPAAAPAPEVVLTTAPGAVPTTAPGAVPTTAPPTAAAFAVPVLPARPAVPAVREDEDPELAAYNRYLAQLAEVDRQN